MVRLHGRQISHDECDHPLTRQRYIAALSAARYTGIRSDAAPGDPTGAAARCAGLEPATKAEKPDETKILPKSFVSKFETTLEIYNAVQHNARVRQSSDLRGRGPKSRGPAVILDPVRSRFTQDEARLPERGLTLLLIDALEAKVALRHV